jgi:hypothetical protein
MSKRGRGEREALVVEARPHAREDEVEFVLCDTLEEEAACESTLLASSAPVPHSQRIAYDDIRAGNDAVSHADSYDAIMLEQLRQDPKTWNREVMEYQA